MGKPNPGDQARADKKAKVATDKATATGSQRDAKDAADALDAATARSEQSKAGQQDKS